MVYVLLGNGFEETEAVAPLDILRRGGIDVKFTALDGYKVTGGHGIVIEADINISELDTKTAEMIVVPGGLGGVENIENSKIAGEKILEVHKNGGKVAAICAGPRVLGKLGIMKNISAVCYPGMEDQIYEANMKPGNKVICDGNIITSMGPGTALDFGFALLETLKGKEEADKIAADMCYKR